MHYKTIGIIKSLVFVNLLGLAASANAITPLASDGKIYFEGLQQNKSVLTISCDSGEYIQQRFGIDVIPQFSTMEDGNNINNTTCSYSLRVLNRNGSAPTQVAGSFVVENGIVRLPRQMNSRPCGNSCK
jgi:hypothetical protein